MEIEAVLNFRYWHPDKDGKPKLWQKQLDLRCINQAQAKALEWAKVCSKSNVEWLAEVFPRLGDPIVLGSKFGLTHHRKDLF